MKVCLLFDNKSIFLVNNFQVPCKPAKYANLSLKSILERYLRIVENLFGFFLTNFSAPCYIAAF